MSSRAMKWTALIWCCCHQCVMAEILLCSDYLVSGLHGVNDTALSASSSFDADEIDCRPRYARLFYPGDVLSTPEILGGWQSRFPPQADQYIQVTFSVDTIIKAVTLQGRYDHYDEWVETYHLLYSMDGISWTKANSSDGSTNLFVGSHDRNTPVTSAVNPNVIARHLRINPQSWSGRITLRFDVSGCQIRNQTGGHSNFSRKSEHLTEETVGSHIAITAMAKVPSLKECALNCYNHITCKSYTYEIVDGSQWCICYKIWLVAPGCYTSNVGVFENQDILDTYGYRGDQEAAMLYKIVEVRKNQTEASTSCTRQYSQLMRVDTTSKLTSLQNTINGYYVLKQDFRFFVSGIYKFQIWSYNGGTDVINSTLWSPDNPDPSEGHCVMLTLTGLSSVDCQQNLYSICGI